MKSKESIEVNRCIARDCLRKPRRTRNGNRWSQAVVRFVGVRNNDVECVRRTALKETDQRLAFRCLQHLGAERSAAEEAGTQSHRHESQRSGFHKYSAFHKILCLSGAETRVTRAPGRLPGRCR